MCNAYTMYSLSSLKGIMHSFPPLNELLLQEPACIWRTEFQEVKEMTAMNTLSQV